MSYHRESCFRTTAVGLVGSFVLAATTALAETPDAPSDPMVVPVTDDGTCEFGYRAGLTKTWSRQEIRFVRDKWVNAVLGQAVQHCKPGALLSVGMPARDAQGSPHDYFTVAALLCRRPEIQEKVTKDDRDPLRSMTLFSCSIDTTKFQKFADRQSRGELLYDWINETVPGRPGDPIGEERMMRAKRLRAGLPYYEWDERKPASSPNATSAASASAPSSDSQPR